MSVPKFDVPPYTQNASEPKPNRATVSPTHIRHIRSKPKQEKQIRLHITERLQRLSEIPLPSLNAMMIVPLPTDDHQALSTCEPMGLVGRVWDEDEEDDGPDTAEGSDDEEFVFP